MANPGALLTGSMTVDPASIAANTTANTDVTVNGVKSGDVVSVYPPATFENGLVVQGATIPSDNTIRIRISNHSAGAVDAASATWLYKVVRANSGIGVYL